MSGTAKLNRPRTSPTWSRGDLVEQVTAAGSPLKVDEEKGVIFRLKVLGPFSRNNHGLTEAVVSEYSPEYMETPPPSTRTPRSRRTTRLTTRSRPPSATWTTRSA